MLAEMMFLSYPVHMLMRFDKPSLRRKDMDAVLQAMVDEQIGPGERLKQFLTQLNQLLSHRGSAYALRSYPSTVTLALLVAGLKRGDKIGVSVLSPAFYHAIATFLGATLLIGDIDPDNGMLSASEAQRLQQAGASLILLHYPHGNIAPQSQYEEITIPLIHDCSESLGSHFGENLDTSWHKLSVYAFEEHHVISSGGGGAFLCQEEAHQERAAQLLNQTNGLELLQMTDLNAALGTIQLAHLQDLLKRRRAHFESYRNALLRGRHTLFGIRDIDFNSNGQAFTVVCDSKPETVIAFAAKYEVPAKMAFRNTVVAHDAPEIEHYPHALPVILRALSFPIYPFLTAQQATQIERVIAHIP